MDTHFTDLAEMIRRDRRNMLIEEKQIISMDKTARRFGLEMKLAVTPTFFNHFFPYAEDATKGVEFEDILWDILKLFKKETGGAVRNGMTFPVLSRTYVKKAYGPDKVETFADGKPRDKRTEIQVFFIPDENDKPSLLFTIQDYKFI